MGHWRDIFSANGEQARHRLHVERRRCMHTKLNSSLRSNARSMLTVTTITNIVLPVYDAEEFPAPHQAKEVTKVALRLKYQIGRVIPCELADEELTSPNSRIITKEVVQTAKHAGNDELRGCIIFALLLCLRWFKIQALAELWDSDLYECRALACEVIAKHMYVIPVTVHTEPYPY